MMNTTFGSSWKWPRCRSFCIVESEMTVIDSLVSLTPFRCEHSAFVDREDVEERPVLLCPAGFCDNVWCKLCQTTITPGGPEHSCEYWTGPIDHFADLRALRERLRGERTQHEQRHARLSGGRGERLT